MSGATHSNLSGRGLHPSHYAALRTEILRTGGELSPDQLVDLTEALIRLSPSGQRPDARVSAKARAFA